jgi:hypothetical protein
MLRTLFTTLSLFFILPLLSAISVAAQEPAPQSAAYHDWRHSGEMWLLTTPAGANLPDGTVVENFPLLVRLHRDWFDFSQAQSKGEDLRVTSNDGRPLVFQIEDWDATKKEANLWVRVPKIYGNSRQMIHLHWGNAAAKSESNGQAVFNASNGYLSTWHMNEPVRDETGLLTSNDTGTTATTGMIGAARHLPGGNGIFGGDKIEGFPVGADSHSTEVWFRAEKPNVTMIGWGNEHAQGKVVMQFRSPPHVRMDCYFSGGNVGGDTRLQVGEWTHVVHTYEKGEAKLYVNGVLDGVNRNQGPPLAIKSPARLFIGGWYHNYEFVGDLDEVRVSKVVRSAEWIKLQYENQKPNQTLVGPLVQTGDEFAVSKTAFTVAEGQTAEVTAKAGGAQKVYWLLKRGEQETVVATDRFSYAFAAGRVRGDGTAHLICRAVYPDSVQSKTIDITIREAIAEPAFTLTAPATWDGRQPLEITPQISNLATLKSQSSGPLNFAWQADNVAVIKQVIPGKLLLQRAQGNGTLRVSVAIDNGGEAVTKFVDIEVKQPATADAWLPQPITENEQPEDNQFIAREGNSREGTVRYTGTLAEAADAVFVRVFSEDKLIATETAKPAADKKYLLAAKLPAGLVKYRTEFGTKSGDRETVVHTAKNIVCGDVFIIIGQSNAVATDFGKENPLKPSDWVRTYGATDGGPQGSRLKQWAPAEARSPGGKGEIGYWGMELGRRLVESEKLPICLINGAVGGTRIDQHQRNNDDATDVKTIYGRLLWRVQQAKLTHGVRAIIWHQGENDQGADGPTGGYGFENYRQFFVDLAASWKTDYPNVERYYAFQIWPKSCSMGINGSDNRLREVQRNLPNLFSNMSIMSTCGVKPPGGCHFPAAGYAEFARLLAPLVQSQLYGAKFEARINPPNLQRAYFANQKRDELVLEFNQPVVWQVSLTNQFHLEGEPKQVESGAVNGNRLTLKLKAPSKAARVTYLDSAAWNPDNLLLGANGIAALTFCEVPIEGK